MYRLITILVFLAVATVATAQPSGFKPVADLAAFKAGLNKSSQATNSIKSNFTQEKNLSMLDEKVISKGTFRFKKENKVRMEYTNPFSYLLVINGDKIQIKDRQKTNSFSSGSNKLFSTVNNIIVDCVKGSALENKDFTSTVYTSDKYYLLELKPAKKELKDYFKTINVFLDLKNYSVVKMDMIEGSGDNTLITFTEKEINTQISDSEFTIQ